MFVRPAGDAQSLNVAPLARSHSLLESHRFAIRFFFLVLLFVEHQVFVERSLIFEREPIRSLPAPGDQFASIPAHNQID